ncbi:HNH endonuclease signature motif containing protein [Arthrobacter sp. C152]
MEAIGEQFGEAYDAGARPARAARLHAVPGVTAEQSDVTEHPAETDLAGLAAPASLDWLCAQLAAAALDAPNMLAGANYLEAAEFAALVEELSRSAERLQIVSAGAVDRTRTRAIADAATARAREGRGSWAVVRWDANGVETVDDHPVVNETDASWPTGPDRPIVTSPADDGCRNTAEFLRIRLRIPIREARRRLALAHHTLPGVTLTGGATPPPREHLAAALTPTAGPSAAAAGTGVDDTGERTSSGTGLECPGVQAPAVSAHAATIITATLERLEHRATPETLERIEQHLTTEAATCDPDFLSRLALRWSDTIDADGTEPTEEALRHTQGAFIRKPRHGLHRLEILATTDQYEHLLTVMNTATNPRTTVPGSSGHMGTGIGGQGIGNSETGNMATISGVTQAEASECESIDLDRRTRPQKQLDGIVTAVKAALATNTLPTSGGNRPQILATINYRDLFPDAHAGSADNPVGANGLADASSDTTSGAGPGQRTGTEAQSETVAATGLETGPETGTRTGTGTGAFVFTGPVAAATLRKMACDADIIPALLGTNGEILDLGRKARLFTSAQRTAITARDQGCAFPNCTIPAPWCEVHHITYWSRGGETNASNGVLLCSHHHHLVHKEQWIIATANGTPAFIPPRHIDPSQKPQRNHYFKPPPPPIQRE